MDEVALMIYGDINSGRNALYELNGKTWLPGKRYYYTENCGLFADLKEIMENKWEPELQTRLSIAENLLAVI